MFDTIPETKWNQIQSSFGMCRMSLFHIRYKSFNLIEQCTLFIHKNFSNTNNQREFHIFTRENRTKSDKTELNGISGFINQTPNTAMHLHNTNMVSFFKTNEKNFLETFQNSLSFSIKQRKYKTKIKNLWKLFASRRKIIMIILIK